MNNLTYKNFLESEILNFDINWEQRRKYIKELKDIEHKNIRIKLLYPLKKKEDK